MVTSHLKGDTGGNGEEAACLLPSSSRSMNERTHITNDKLFYLNRLCKEARKELAKAQVLPEHEAGVVCARRRLKDYDELLNELLNNNGDQLARKLKQILIRHECAVPALIEDELFEEAV